MVVTALLSVLTTHLVWVVTPRVTVLLGRYVILLQDVLTTPLSHYIQQVDFSINIHKCIAQQIDFPIDITSIYNRYGSL
jgi:hypothetical protein